jgi:hypothetical protein
MSTMLEFLLKKIKHNNEVKKLGGSENLKKIGGTSLISGRYYKMPGGRNQERQKVKVWREEVIG